MLQEQLNDRSVTLSVKAGKITARLLAQSMRAFLKNARKQAGKTGAQSMKSLTRDGASLENVEITGDNIGTFKKTARKYNVAFSLKRDNSETPPRWLVFFKAKDSASMDAAFTEYSKATLKQKEIKAPMLDELAKMGELAKTVAPPVKNRDRGELAR
jgi:hypothetical protein